MRFGRLLLMALVSAVQAADEPTPPLIVVADAVPRLTNALADARTEIVVLRLNAADLDRPSALRLTGWVERGGTLWCETDAARLFGFDVNPITPRERIVHGRRAGALGASVLLNGVNDIWAHLAENNVLLLSHASALPLLRVADPVVGYPAPRMAAALLPYGQGQVICRPTTIHSSRADSARFEANLRQFCTRLNDEAIVPVETLTIAAGRLVQARDLLARYPAEAKKRLNEVFLAYRLWYADYLTAARQLNKATALLAGVAAELPDDPAVYLAVARLNDALGRTEPAAEARRQAAAAYLKLKKEAPTADARQVRVPWAIFAESVNAVGRAWTEPTAQNVAQAVARTQFLLGLDLYRRYDLTRAETWWKDAAAAFATWPLPNYHLGLLYETAGDNPRLPSRERAGWYAAAAEQFARAAEAAPTAEFTDNAVTAATAWAKVAQAAAQRTRNEPPDVLLRPGVIFRFNGADRRLQVGPQRESLIAAFTEAYRLDSRWGVYPEDIEVLCYDSVEQMTAVLPRTGVTRQAFGSGAVVGRRIYTVAEPEDMVRVARHSVSHVYCNALWEGGFPPPLWFQEGLCWWTQEIATQRQLALVNIRRGRFMSVPQLNDPDTFYDRRNADHAWGQAQLMVEALVDRFGMGSIVQMQQATGWGLTTADAFRQLTSMSQEDFMAAWLQGRLGSGR